MKLVRNAGIFAFLSAALSHGTAAADPATDAGLSKLRSSPAYQRFILDAVQDTTVYKAVTCEGAKYMMVGPIYVMKPPAFDRNGKPVAGDWSERVIVTGCGAEHKLNVLTHVRGPSSIESEFMLPGTTIASLQLQKDAISFAFDAARIDRSGCKPIYVLDTAFIEFFKPPNPAITQKPWSELWTVAQCDKRKVIKMTFVPDETGTAIGAREN